MSERASNLVGGICGLAAVGLLVAGFPFTGATPEPGASVDDVAEYLSRSGAQTWTGIYMEFFGLALLIIFVGRLWALLREAEGAVGWIATTALGAAVAALTVLVIGDATMMGAAFSAGRHGLDPAVVGGMYTVQWYSDLAYGVVNAVFFAASALLVLRRGALPRWLGWLAVVVAITLVVTVPFGPGTTMEPPHVLGFLWIVSVSILMIARSDALPSVTV
jgi:riboflavin transporter FmnP